MRQAIVILTIFNFFSKLNAQPIENEIYRGTSPYELNKKEIRDSGYHSLLIHTLYSDHIGNENWRDTLYFARFDSQGRTIYEKRTRLFEDSVINEYTFNTDGSISKTICHRVVLVGTKGAKTFIIENSYDRNQLTGSRYTTLAPGKKPVYENKKLEYNKEGKLVREIEESTTRHYDYDTRGRLVKEEYKSGDSSLIFYHYKYELNGPDSIVNISAVEKYGEKTDSTFLKQIYNSRGNLLLESRKVSPTYYKTFHPFCTTGDEYINRYQYDEKDRKIIDGNFVREGTDYEHKWILESREQTTVLKTYLSKKSELLLYIDRMDGPGGNEKTFFDYSK